MYYYVAIHDAGRSAFLAGPHNDEAKAEAAKLLFDSCASVFDVTPLVMGRGSHRSHYPGATPLPFRP